VLTYAGNRPNLADIEDRIVFVQGDICDGAGAEDAAPTRRSTPSSTSPPSRTTAWPSSIPGCSSGPTSRDPDHARSGPPGRRGPLPPHLHLRGLRRPAARHRRGLHRGDSRTVPARPTTPRRPGPTTPCGPMARPTGCRPPSPTAATTTGPYQFPEKVIPHFTPSALDDQPLTLYATTENRREWLHVDDHCTAIEAVLRTGTVGETYHVGSGIEASIMEIADRHPRRAGQAGLAQGDRPRSSRHDRRYLLDSSKLRTELGWAPTVPGSRAWPTRWPGTRPTGAGGSRCGPGPRWSRGPGAPETPAERPLRILVTGANGQLGRDLLDCLAGRVPAGGRRCSLLGARGPCPGSDHEVLATDIDTMRVDDRDAVLTVFTRSDPDSSCTAAPSPRWTPARPRSMLAYAVNAIGTRNVAEAAAPVGAHVVYVSTDYVFDGTAIVRTGSGTPRTRRRSTALQAGGERECRPGSTIVRTSVGVRGPRGQHGQAPRCAWPMARGICASSTISTGRPRSRPTWPRPSSPSGSTDGPGSST
jgi:dTDP-glucose 4,6-dehydratase